MEDTIQNNEDIAVIEVDDNEIIDIIEINDNEMIDNTALETLLKGEKGDTGEKRRSRTRWTRLCNNIIRLSSDC